MKNRIALALFPIALFSMAAKGGCETSEEPIVSGASDAAVTDAATCAPLPCPSGATFSPTECACVQATDAAPASDSSTCAPLPCPSGATFSPTECACIEISDATSADTGPTQPVSGDCAIPTPATSPINVYVADPPSGSISSDYTMSALGSAGDTVTLTLAFVLGDGTLNFTGSGESTETYQLTLDYKGTSLFEATTTWSVAGCGFLENIDLATDAHSP